jgi:hypothetical protein
MPKRNYSGRKKKSTKGERRENPNYVRPPGIKEMRLTKQKEESLQHVIRMNKKSKEKRQKRQEKENNLLKDFKVF